MTLKYIRISSLALLVVVISSFQARSQYSTVSGGQVIDNIIAKVDNYVVLKSDLDKAYLQYVSQGQKGGEEARCGILQQLLLNKLLVAKAEIDSVIVEDSEVKSNLDQRMQVIISQIGSEDKIEQYYGKSVDDFKAELYDEIKEQMTVQKMESNITEDINVTPTEVKRFFNNIPKDSLPFLSKEVEVGQIVKIPKAGEGQKEKARQLAISIRNRILNGRNLTSEYAGWKIKITNDNKLSIVDASGKEYKGTWEFDARDLFFTIKLNEISFAANAFQFTWNIKRMGPDSLRFDNSDINNTSKFFLRRDIPFPKNSTAIDNSLLTGNWSVVGFYGNGEDFGKLAAEYSDDPGSAKQGGNLGFASRGIMVPQYEAAAMRLKPGEISQPIETEFGYHIIQLIERRGNEYNTRHILIKPDFSKVDFQNAENFLDSIRTLILDDSIKFENAAKEFSDDQATSGNGGFIFDNNQSARVSVEDLDPVIFFTIDTMKVGAITHPIRYRMQDGKEAVRILYYKSSIKPHQISLKEDYQKVQLAALEEKKQNLLQKWFNDARQDVYIQIDDEYKHCHILQ